MCDTKPPVPVAPDLPAPPSEIPHRGYFQGEGLGEWEYYDAILLVEAEGPDWYWFGYYSPAPAESWAELDWNEFSFEATLFMQVKNWPYYWRAKSEPKIIWPHHEPHLYTFDEWTYLENLDDAKGEIWF